MADLFDVGVALSGEWKWNKDSLYCSCCTVTEAPVEPLNLAVVNTLPHSVLLYQIW